MRRIGILFFLLFVCGRVFADINVELDVVFSGSTIQCRYLYVLSPSADGVNDTLAVFDTLSFKGHNRVSLFYTAGFGEENVLSRVDSGGMNIVSQPFRVSPRRTVFYVVFGEQHIEITGKDYLYLRKNENERSYYVFLLIFFVVKIMMTTIFVLFSKLPMRVISITSGAFLLSAFFDWLFPLNYLYWLLLIMLTECLLITFFGNRYISWLKTALLVLVVNMAGFGTIIFLYVMYVFW